MDAFLFVVVVWLSFGATFLSLQPTASSRCHGIIHCSLPIANQFVILFQLPIISHFHIFVPFHSNK